MQTTEGQSTKTFLKETFRDTILKGTQDIQDRCINDTRGGKRT